MSARSSASFMRRTAPKSSTPKQRAYLRALLASRDLSSCPFPAMSNMLVGLLAQPSVIDELSIDGAASFIDGALSCAELTEGSSK